MTQINHHWRRAIGTGSLLAAAAVTVMCPPAAADSATPPLVGWAQVTGWTCAYGDCEDGRGTLELTTPFGMGSYSGGFRAGRFHGYGRLEVPVSWLDRAVYAGNWADGVRRGRGTFWNGDGKLYIGEWQDDKRHGTGSYFFKLPEWRENANTEHGLRDRYENYSGEFRNDLFHGRGSYRWPNGARYEGGFFANDRHGFGTFYYPTGTAREQLWNYGDFVR